METACGQYAPGTFELMCHPGLYEQGFSEKDSWSARREVELQILTDPDFGSLIRQSGIELIDYAKLGV